MEKAYNNSSAFPLQDEHGIRDAGMTLLDWFAGQALAGLCVSDATAKANPTYQKVAVNSYAQAEAMLAERKRRLSNEN